MGRAPIPTRAILLSIFKSAVQAAHPALCLPDRLPPPPEGRLFLLAAGKAAGSMVVAAEKYYLKDLRLDQSRLAGHAVARHGYGVSGTLIPMIEAGHPVPDAAGIEASSRALELAASAGPGDLVLVLLSGGGSANWIAPAGQLTLDEKQAITKALLRSGAAIGEINTVRKRLSRIKGGRLAQAASRSSLLTLAISDVPGDDPSAIASGPTVPDPTTLAEARAIIARYNIKLPDSARALLDDEAAETPKPGDPLFANNRFKIVARPSDAMAAAAATARVAGYEPVELGADLEGEARDIARTHATLALELKASGKKCAIVSGGELTVTIRGNGRGGPNQEYALALAIALGGARGIVALAGDTDGTDGGAGSASDPAGALVDDSTLSRADELGLDPVAYLANNDSTGFFQRLGDLLTPGPTFTNVNDCRVILIDP